MPADWVCYLLRCKDGSLYCGITNDLEKRLNAHNAGVGAKYTRGRHPVILAYAEVCGEKPAALRRELEIKRLTRREKQLLCNGRSVRRLQSVKSHIREVRVSPSMRVRAE